MDLIIIIGLTIITVPLIALTGGIFRAVLGVIFVLFIPGYALISALFPKRQSLRTIERFVLSVGASLATVTLIGVALNFTPLGVKLWPVVGVTVFFVIAASAIAWLRRSRLPVDERFSFAAVSGTVKTVLVTENKNSKLRNIIYASIVVVVLGSLGAMYAVSSLSSGPPSNEFYLLSAEGTTTNYTRTLHLGEPVAIDAVIVNHQSRPLDYDIKVTTGGVEELAVNGIQVSPNQKWQKELSFIPQTVGDNQKVEYLLFDSDNTTAPVDRLYIWVDVRK